MTASHKTAHAVIACALMFVALAPRAQSVAPPPLKLGVIVAATGPAAGLGTAARSGALLAQKQLNAAGGVGGRQVQLLIRDDATNPDTALTHANELVRAEKVDVVVALTTTASSIAVGSVTSTSVGPADFVLGHRRNHRARTQVRRPPGREPGRQREGVSRLRAQRRSEEDGGAV